MINLIHFYYSEKTRFLKKRIGNKLNKKLKIMIAVLLVMVMIVLVKGKTDLGWKFIRINNKLGKKLSLTFWPMLLKFNWIFFSNFLLCLLFTLVGTEDWERKGFTAKLLYNYLCPSVIFSAPNWDIAPISFCVDSPHKWASIPKKILSVGLPVRLQKAEM